MKLDGYSETSTDERLLVKFTSQLTGKAVFFSSVAVSRTNGRYQQFSVTPPAGTDRMKEGLYLVGVYNTSASKTYAERLAFVRSPVAFGESTYTAYTAEDNTAYNVWTQ